MEFLAIINKELRLLFKFPGTFVMLLVMPVVFVIVLSQAFETLVVGKPHFELTVIDLDHSPLSEELTARLRQNDALDVRLEQRSDARLEEADVEGVLDEERFAALVIPQGFERAVEEPGEATLTLFGDPARKAYVDLLGEQMEHTLAIEQLASAVSLLVAEAGGGSEEDARETVRSAVGSAVQAAAIESVPASDRQTFPSAFEQTVPGFSVMFGFLAGFYISWNLIRERTEFHTWPRTIAAPVSRTVLGLGRLVAYGLLGVAQLSVMLLLGWAVWDMNLGSSPPALWLVIGAWSLASVTFGLLVGSFLRSVQATASVMYLSLILLGALGGALIPTAFLPGWMQAVSVAVPQRWAMDGIQDLIVRGGGLVDVLPHLAVLLAFSAAFFAVSVRPRAAE